MKPIVPNFFSEFYGKQIMFAVWENLNFKICAQIYTFFHSFVGLIFSVLIQCINEVDCLYKVNKWVYFYTYFKSWLKVKSFYIMEICLLLLDKMHELHFRLVPSSNTWKKRNSIKIRKTFTPALSVPLTFSCL